MSAVMNHFLYVGDVITISHGALGLLLEKPRFTANTVWECRVFAHGKVMNFYTSYEIRVIG